MNDECNGELKSVRERGHISASTYQIELLIYWREKRKKRRRKEKRGERDVFSVDVGQDLSSSVLPVGSDNISTSSQS